MNRVRRILNLESGDGRLALLLFIYMTFILAAYIIQKSVRDALFLHEYGAMRLPILYLAVALLTALFVSIYVRLSSKVGQIPLISGTLLLFMFNGVLMWWTSSFNWKPLSIIYYLWANTSGIILTAQVWTLVTTILSSEQAKRLVPFICSGGILGSTLGGLIAAASARRMGTENLILVPAVLMIGCLVIVRILGRISRRFPEDLRLHCETPTGSRSVSEVLKITANTRYLRLIAALLSISAVVTLIVDFQFKVVIEHTYHNRDVLAAFFGSFYAYAGLISFFVQFFAGSRIFARYGLPMVLLFLPLALLSGTVALLVFPTMLWTGILLKGSDGVLRGSIDKSTMELLYIPIPQPLRIHVRSVLDMLIQRFSDGVGGVLLLIMTQVLGIGFYGIGLFNGALLLLWLWIAYETRSEYHAASQETPRPVQRKAAAAAAAEVAAA